MIKLIKKIIPSSIRKKLWFFKRTLILRNQERKEIKALDSLSGKENIKVAFLLVNESIWKYKELYFLLKKDKRFDPKIFICPYIEFGDKIMQQEMENTFISFKNQGYNVVKTIKENGSYLDVKEEFKPDLVFFSTPWSLTLPQYKIENYLDRLTCYVNYSYTTSTNFINNYNNKLHNLCWKYFLESNSHKELARKYSDRKGKNTLVTGYAGTDVFLDPNYKSEKDPWKKQDKKKKRIIWAPHHSVDSYSKKNLLTYATFLKYSDFMLEIAEKQKEAIQIAFKPHPVLKGKLYRIWGEERTEKYYKTWQELSNGQLEEGGYVDLFLQSDAMIHDSSSFLIEYLFTHKPVLFLINNEEMKNQFNNIGKKALTKIPQAHTEEDILNFINETVLEEKDLYKDKRKQFFEEYLQPPHNRLASENIYYYLIEKLKLN